MGKRILRVCSAVAATGTVLAADFVITSFDASGQLTFREMPGAAFYEVESTTDLEAGPWSSAPPGLPLVLPSGTGTVTVTVGIEGPRRFFRVRSISRPAASTIATNFDSDDGGWRVVQYPFRSHVQNPGTSAAFHDADFGNPAGALRIGDVHPETGIAAPAAYLGDMRAYYGGTLSYDIYLRYSDAVPYPAVVLNGGGMSLYYDHPSPALGVWTRISVPLTETGWKVSSAGRAATNEELATVLSNLVGIYIYTEWHTGPDDTHVDNVVLAPQAPAS